MTKTEIRDAAEAMADELREMENGTGISSLELLRKYWYDTDRFDDRDLTEFHSALLRTARANRIALDMPKRGDTAEKPYLLPFTVLNRRAQIKCPFCGRTNTARILYGMPLFNHEMQAKLDSGKLRLGECVISTAEDGNGNRVWIGPERFCNNCRREFARPAYLLSKDRKSAEAYRDIVTGIRFSTWAEREPDDRTEIILKKNTEGAVLFASRFQCDKEPIIIKGRQISESQWMRLVDRLYSDLHLHEWKHHSEDNFHDFKIMDGERFKLEITLTNGRKRTYDGNIGYLPYWPELKTLFKPFLKA